MDSSVVPVSYHALRVCDESVAIEWWVYAHEHRHDAPAAVQALLSGRTRVEVSEAEAIDAIEWAAHVPGWQDGGATPLLVHPPVEPT
jgi:hypothetical protein